MSIKALTRNPESSSAKKLTEQGVHVVKGSYDEPETLVKALQGVDAAYLVTDNSSGVESASVWLTTSIREMTLMHSVRRGGAVKTS